MAKKGKAKISKVKRNNQTTNKMKKQGKLKLQRHKAKVQKQKQPLQKKDIEYSSESEASGDEWADMLDDEEQKYILKRIATQPQLLSNVPGEEKKNKSEIVNNENIQTVSPLEVPHQQPKRRRIRSPFVELSSSLTPRSTRNPGHPNEDQLESQQDDQLEAVFNFGSDLDTDDDEDEAPAMGGMTRTATILLDTPRDAEPVSQESPQPEPLNPWMSDPMYHFQWKPFPSPPIPPESRREQFTAFAGPNVPNMTPIEIFKNIWDVNIMGKIVTETNRYAEQLAAQMMEQNILSSSSRICGWKDTNINELYTFFGITLAMGVVIKSRLTEYWNTCDDIFVTPNFKAYMSVRRFQLLCTCLHFNDNSLMPANVEESEARLHKIKPILTHLNEKFQSMYTMGRNISLDESLLQWRGWLQFNQLIANKAATVGIKTYEVCESQTGYLWRFVVHTHSGSKMVPHQDPLCAFTPSLVLKLLEGLEHKGYTVWMDSFYNSPILARKLKSLGFDCVGTLRTNRQFVPTEINQLDKSQMRRGQIAGVTCGDVDLMVWRDNNRVAMISTYHGNLVTTDKDGTTKPILIHDYNIMMGGVDKKDQLLAHYPIERKRCTVWYKKLFRRLLNVSVQNAYIIYSQQNRLLYHREFRKHLIKALIKENCPNDNSSRRVNVRRHDASNQYDVRHHYLAEYPHASQTSKGRLRRICNVCRRRTTMYCMGCDKATCLPCHPKLHGNLTAQTGRSRKRKREDKGKMPKPTRGAASDSGAETDSDTNVNSDGSSNEFEEDGSELEDKYEKERAERPVKRVRPLLPIKTKEGVMERTEEVEDTESEEESEPEEPPAKQKKTDSDLEGSDSDSGMEGTADEAQEGDGDKEGEVVTAVQLLAARRDKLQHEKLRIGALCSSLLEQPEKKLKNLYPILYFMEERLKDGSPNLPSIRKLATLSACEVFKDVLPDYLLRHQDYSNVKLKKDTLALYKYEKELLEFYKRYLQRLEKAATALRQKRGDTRKLDESTRSIALVSLRCMCSMLVSRPHFNYATNIAQSVVPYLDCEASAAELVTDACKKVFADDNKGDITLAIVRLINQLVKRRGERLKPSALDCLLSLKITDIDMDAQADIQHKKKQEEKKKKRIVNLSKKEKKRMKKLKEVERELLETEAQESDMARRKQLTEVTKTVFHIYFRLLKSAPRSALLAAALQGIAKFTHVINLEYYSDLVGILSRLLRDDAVPPRSRLLCARGALAVLRGAGDALNVDPASFHAYLFANALDIHAGATHQDTKLVIEAIDQICSRARRVSSNVLQAFGKRLGELALQLQHNGTISCLVLLHTLIQQSKPVSSLLEPDPESGSGRYEPQLPSPEHCGADRAALYELAALRRHHHPTVRAMAAALHTGTLPQELNKMSPTKVLEQYDGSQMSFKPAVPPPSKGPPKAKVAHAHGWAQSELKTLCETVEKSVDMKITSVR